MSSKIVLIAIAVLIILLIGFLGYRFYFPAAPEKNLKELPKEKSSLTPSQERESSSGHSFKNIFIADFGQNKVFGVSREGDVFFEYDGVNPRLPWSKQFWVAEYVSVAPDGNLMVTDAQGQRVVKIDRKTKKILWEYGHREHPGCAPGYLHAPDIAFQLKDGNILINDGNNRRVIIINPETDEIIWQYGHNMAMGDKPGFLMGNTFASETPEGNILITDTLQKKFLIVSRKTKEILWEWQKEDLKWPQNASITPEGNIVFTDRQTGNLYEIDKNGNIVWEFISNHEEDVYFVYPIDIFKLKNGNYLIADSELKKIVELDPKDNSIVWQLGKGKPQKQNHFGFPSSIAIEE